MNNETKILLGIGIIFVALNQVILNPPFTATNIINFVTGFSLISIAFVIELLK